MINDIISMNGYGIYVWSAFAFTLISFAALYTVIKVQLVKEKIKFGHSKFYNLPNNILLVGSYHPSPRNVNTGRIDINKMTSLFKKIKKII